MVKPIVPDEIDELVDIEAKGPDLSVMCREQEGGNETLDEENDEDGEERNDNFIAFGVDELSGESVVTQDSWNAEDTVQEGDDATALGIGDIANKSMLRSEEVVRTELVVCGSEHGMHSGGLTGERGPQGGKARRHGRRRTFESRQGILEGWREWRKALMQMWMFTRAQQSSMRLLWEMPAINALLLLRTNPDVKPCKQAVGESRDVCVQ